MKYSGKNIIHNMMTPTAQRTGLELLRSFASLYTQAALMIRNTIPSHSIKNTPFKLLCYKKARTSLASCRVKISLQKNIVVIFLVRLF